MEEKGAMLNGQIMLLHYKEYCMGQVLAAQADDGFREHNVRFSYMKFPFCGKPEGYNLERPTRETWINS